MGGLIRQILLLACLLSSYPIFGHVPVFLERDSSTGRPHNLKRPYNQSIAIYTFFESKSDLDVYQFEVSEEDLEEGPIEVLVGTLVPACEPLAGLLVSWVLVGPKQEALTEVGDTGLPDGVKITDQDGVLYISNQKQGDIWREPYTAHYYFRQIRRKVKLSKTGKYRIFVWPSRGKKGDYVLEFGDEEIWSIPDILFTLWVYPKLIFEGEIITEGCITSNMNG